MSTRRTPLAAVVCACLAWTAVSLASPDTDVTWIGRLPGLAPMTSKTTASGSKSVYTLSGNLNATFDSIIKGLSDRGWTIDKSTNTPVAGIESRTLRARKAGALLRVSAQDVMGLSQLTLTLTGAQAGSTAAESDPDATEQQPAAAAPAAKPAAPAPPAAAQPPAPASAPAANPAPAARTQSSGLPLALVENRADGTYDCQGRDVSIAGDHCKVRLEGECRSLKVLGNHNHVTVAGSIQSIQALGGHNHVSWSIEKNPRRPKVVNLGSNNKVGPEQPE